MSDVKPAAGAPERIKEIRERLEAATPRPWSVALGSGYNVMTLVRYENPENGDSLPICDCLPDWFLKEGYSPRDYDHRPNMNFIAHSPDDIAYLLASLAASDMVIDGQVEIITELEARLDRVEGAAREYTRAMDFLSDYHNDESGSMMPEDAYDAAIDRTHNAYDNLKRVLEQEG